MTKNEAAALRVTKRYRREVDELESVTMLLLARRFLLFQKEITADIEDLYAQNRDRASMAVSWSKLRPKLEQRTTAYIRDAQTEMVRLSKRTAKLGARAADAAARKVTREEDQTWKRISTAGLLTGKLFTASKDALSKIPDVLSGKVRELVSTALGMAEKGAEWLKSQLGDILSGVWSGIQKIIRTAAEQMFRRGQQEQREEMPVQKWRRVANHETACLACLLAEGTVYDKTEDFGDHPNGRCYIVPCEGDAKTEHPGKDWLEQQDEETQRRILGRTRYEAWKAGELDLDQMTDVRIDPEYGPLPHVITLEKLGIPRAK